MPKKIILITFLAVLTVATILIVAKLYLTKPSLQQKAPAIATSPKLISFSLKSSESEVKVGDKISGSLYLEGKEAENVSGFDVKINYDKTKLKLVKATPGTFFSDSLTVKWDLEKSWFVATINPLKTAMKPLVGFPLLTLEFAAISKSNSTAVSVSSDSMVVYSTSNTGSYPKGNSVLFSIK